MVVFRTQDLVDDVAVVGQQDQAFGVLVEPADRENALAMATKSTMLPATSRSVVQMMPTGLFSAM